MLMKNVMATEGAGFWLEIRYIKHANDTKPRIYLFIVIFGLFKFINIVKFHNIGFKWLKIHTLYINFIWVISIISIKIV